MQSDYHAWLYLSAAGSQRLHEADEATGQRVALQLVLDEAWRMSLDWLRLLLLGAVELHLAHNAVGLNFESRTEALKTQGRDAFAL